MKFNIQRSRVILFVLVAVLLPTVLVVRAQDSGWQERFSHTLGITFELPAGYELMPGYEANYSNGSDVIEIEPVNSMLIHSLDLEEACNIVALDTPGYEVQVVRGNKRGVCVYNKGRQAYSTLITPDHRYLMDGGEYDYLVIRAPKNSLLAVTESIDFVERVDPPLYLDEAVRLIRVNFVYPDLVNWDAIYQQAMAMVNDNSSMEDAYGALNYVFEQIKTVSAHDGGVMSLDEELYSLYEIQDRLGYVLTDSRAGQYRSVILVYANSPAEKAGLRVGDVVQTINGKDARFVNEPQRRKVTLGVRRVGEAELLTIGIIPKQYNQYLPVAGRRLADDIGYIETFTAGYRSDYDALFRYPNDAHDTIRQVDAGGTCGWIVDVRRNHGGSALVMGLALGPLRGDGRWFGMRSVTGEIQWFDYEYGAFPSITTDFTVIDPYELRQPNPPIAVLVSAETASMGEMTAFVMQNRPDATTRIFGEPTGGYLSDAFTVWSLIDGTQLALVNDRGVAPSRELLPYSITPDVEIRTDYTVFGSEDDPVIQAARAWLLEQPECG